MSITKRLHDAGYRMKDGVLVAPYTRGRVAGIETIQAVYEELIGHYGKRKVNSIIRRAALITRDAARMKAPELGEGKGRTTRGKKYHYRYGSGGGRARYTKGNLKRSIQVFTLGGAVVVGPKIKRGKSKDASDFIGEFAGGRGGKYDGYYGHFVEYGATIVHRNGNISPVPAQPYMRPAYEQTMSVVKNKIATDFKTHLRRFSPKKVNLHTRFGL